MRPEEDVIQEALEMCKAVIISEQTDEGDMSVM